MDYEEKLEILEHKKQSYLKEAFYNKNKNLFIYKPLLILFFCLLIYYFEFGIYFVVLYIIFKIGIFEQTYYDTVYYTTDLEIKILDLNKQIEALEEELSKKIEYIEDELESLEEN